MTVRRFTLGLPGENVLTFNGAKDGDGVEWTMKTPVGWDDTPPVRREGRPLPLADGGRVVDGYRAERILELTGAIAHADQEVVRGKLDVLKGVLTALRSDVEFTALESTPKMVRARRSGQITTKWYGPVCEWEAQLVAADWRKYVTADVSQQLLPYVADSQRIDLTAGSGADLAVNLTDGSGVNLALNFAGSAGSNTDVEVTNQGTARVYPVLFFYGPSSGQVTLERVTNLTTGEVANLAVTLSPGDVYVLDMEVVALGKEGDAVLFNGDASWYSTWQVPRTPIGLEPGVNVMRFEILAGSLTATATVRYRHGWE